MTSVFYHATAKQVAVNC